MLACAKDCADPVMPTYKDHEGGESPILRTLQLDWRKACHGSKPGDCTLKQIVAAKRCTSFKLQDCMAYIGL